MSDEARAKVPAAALAEGPSPRVLMDQKDETFLPHVLAVPVGTTVDFRNEDEIFHILEGTMRFEIGGKTGTAEKLVRGRYSKNKVFTTFMAIAPAGQRPTWINTSLEISDKMDLVYVPNRGADLTTPVATKDAQVVYPGRLH
mgnify:CR=1 FL=1